MLKYCSIWEFLFFIFYILFLISPLPAQAVGGCCVINPPDQLQKQCKDQPNTTPECESFQSGKKCTEVVTCPQYVQASAGGAAAASAKTTVVGLPNPLGTADVAVIIGRIISVFTGFVGGIALLVFIYGGFQWLTALGNPEKIKKGQEIMLWAILGLVIMFGSYIAAKFIITALTTGAGIV